nr:uridine kinase-like protein 1, chloroplastic [Ipomoea batatas]
MGILRSYGIVAIFSNAFETEQLLECVGKLKAGQSVQVPIYDFKSHQRCSDSLRQVLFIQFCLIPFMFPFPFILSSGLAAHLWSLASLDAMRAWKEMKMAGFKMWFKIVQRKAIGGIGLGDILNLHVEDIPKRMGRCLHAVDNFMLSLYFSD